VDIEGRRRSTKFEDRGSGGRGGGGLPVTALASIVRLFGVKGAVIVGVVGAAFFFLAPASLKQAAERALGRRSHRKPERARCRQCLRGHAHQQQGVRLLARRAGFD